MTTTTDTIGRGRAVALAGSSGGLRPLRRGAAGRPSLTSGAAVLLGRSSAALAPLRYDEDPYHRYHGRYGRHSGHGGLVATRGRTGRARAPQTRSEGHASAWRGPTARPGAHAASAGLLRVGSGAAAVPRAPPGSPPRPLSADGRTEPPLPAPARRDP